MAKTSTWKVVERKIAAKLNGQRVGNRGTNSEDVEHDLFSVEVKHRKAMPKIIKDSMDQCRRNAPDGKTPLVVLHASGSPRYMCVLDIEDLIKLTERSAAVTYIDETTGDTLTFAELVTRYPNADLAIVTSEEYPQVRWSGFLVNLRPNETVVVDGEGNVIAQEVTQ